MYFSALPSLRPLIWLILVIILPVEASLSLLFVVCLIYLFKSNSVRGLSAIAFYLFLTCTFLNLKPENHVFGLRSDENSILVIESFKSNATNWKSIVARDLETNERHLLRLQTKDELVERDTLVVNAKWKVIEPALIPGGFNPKQYYSSKGINKEAFVQNYVLIKGPRINTLVKQLKREFKTQLRKLTPEHQALCSGMILGDKTEIERKVLDQFRACGLMHILAVSGMHVGLLASLPLLLLSLLPKNWIWFRLILKIFSIASVWGFAYFVGLGPSVVRSSIMFSAFLMSSQRSHLSSKINLLCATAFTMLLLEPKWLYELGFQLSFVAVLGILLLGSMLTTVYSNCAWIVKKIFGVMNISVSAQLFTLPLGVYYFHEFPSYFLLGNLAIAPLLVLAIYLCLLLILLNIVGCSTSWLIGLIDQLLSLAIYIAKGISELPNAVIQNLQISSGLVLMIFLVIGVTVAKIDRCKNQALKLVHLMCCLVAVSFIIRMSSLSISTGPVWLTQEMVFVKKRSAAVLFSTASEKTTLRVAEQLEKQKGMQIKVVKSTDTLISIPFEIGAYHDLLFLEDEVYVNPFSSGRISSLIEGQRRLPKDSVP